VCPKGIDDGPKAVELVKLGGPCSRAPGAHIAARASLQAGVDDGRNGSHLVHLRLVQLPLLTSSIGLIWRGFGDGGVVVDALLKVYHAKHARRKSIAPDAAS
jgi:hypothetical protein